MILCRQCIAFTRRAGLSQMVPGVHVSQPPSPCSPLQKAPSSLHSPLNAPGVSRWLCLQQGPEVVVGCNCGKEKPPSSTKLG